jgi:hypothetical protein
MVVDKRQSMKDRTRFFSVVDREPGNIVERKFQVAVGEGRVREQQGVPSKEAGS